MIHPSYGAKGVGCPRTEKKYTFVLLNLDKNPWSRHQTTCVGGFLLNQFLKLQLWGLRREDLENKLLKINGFTGRDPCTLPLVTGLAPNWVVKIPHSWVWIYEIKSDFLLGCLGGRIAEPSDIHGVGKQTWNICIRCLDRRWCGRLNKLMDVLLKWGSPEADSETEFGVQYVYQGFNSFERKEGRNRFGQEKSNCDTALTNLMGSFGTRIASQFCRLGELTGPLSPYLALSLGIDHLAMWGQCVWPQQGSSLSLRRSWQLETVCWS